MINIDNYLKFIPGVMPPQKQNDADLWFVFHNDKLLVKHKGDELLIPKRANIRELKLSYACTHYLGSLNKIHCFCSEVLEDVLLPADMEFKDLRSTGLLIDDALFLTAGKAIQIINWDKTHKYCGKCGSSMEEKQDERAKVCPQCGLMNFPRISPAIIVAVTKGDEILLAHNHRFPDNMYSIIAGFVEPGETFEECVKREVFEETGIMVEDIRYYASQPWPFPNSLMIGFTARYAGGEVKPDGVEIAHADWFNIDNLPNLPSKISIAGKMINAYIERMKTGLHDI